jgi:hypothetical protein
MAFSEGLPLLAAVQAGGRRADAAVGSIRRDGSGRLPFSVAASSLPQTSARVGGTG